MSDLSLEIVLISRFNGLYPTLFTSSREFQGYTYSSTPSRLNIPLPRHYSLFTYPAICCGHIAKMATSTPVDKASENDRGPCLTCCIQTSSHCKACVGVRPDTETMHKAYFCGKECQTAGWPEHKKLCKHVQIVKRLYRAGDILQRIFFIARKHTFEFSIDKVEKKNGKLHIHQSTTPISGFFTEFPDHLNLAIEDREALMAYNCCGGAIMAIHSIVPMLLNGM